mmetsp:Transcript_1726/g.3684  ORF Transcript_1726/g.3684 Transcript_1726/m.3684 type:complete len:141 (-) Transcript_1726:137-559(-)
MSGSRPWWRRDDADHRPSASRPASGIKVRIRIVPDDPDVSTRFAHSVPPRGLAVASEVCRAATGASLAPADSHAALAQRLKESRCTRLAAPYDARADVYSYGVLFWEIMHERIPFAGLLGIQVRASAPRRAIVRRITAKR